jgi:RNA polymerase sigma factor (sigma-70 family)
MRAASWPCSFAAVRHNAPMTVAQEASGAGLSPTVSRAAEELFHEHSGWLYGYCLRVLRSPEEAEDAVQATYLNACRSLGSGTRPRAGSAWLVHIARNVCFTRLRSARRRECVERLGDIAVLEETVAAPDRSYDSLVGLTDALLSLPERQREAILLREWQGLSHSEIAERLGITHSAAETLIFRARRSLANALENPGKRRRFRALHVLDLGALLGPLKGLLAGGAGVKGATALTVAALTTATVVATDPASVTGLGRGSTAAPTAKAPPAAAPASVSAATASGGALTPAADGATSDRPDHGRAHGRATADAAKAKPKANAPNGNANGHRNRNGSGGNNGKALGKTKGTPALPPTANGEGTPAGGKSKAPGQNTPSEPAASPGPPEHAPAIGFGKDKPAKGN